MFDIVVFLFKCHCHHIHNHCFIILKDTDKPTYASKGPDTERQESLIGLLAVDGTVTKYIFTEEKADHLFKLGHCSKLIN